MMNKKQVKEEKRKFWDKFKEYYDKIPLNCKLCKEFLADSVFIEDNKIPYGCGENEDAKAVFIKNCDEFKLGKWCLVSVFRKLIKRINELERLVKIHKTFMQNQYQYDKSLIMKRFDKLEENRDLNKKIKKK